MAVFYGKTYRDGNKVIGIIDIVSGKLSRCAIYNLKTKVWTKYSPLCKGAKELQSVLDKYAHEVGLPEIDS